MIWPYEILPDERRQLIADLTDALSGEAGVETFPEKWPLIKDRALADVDAARAILKSDPHNAPSRIKLNHALSVLKCGTYMQFTRGQLRGLGEHNRFRELYEGVHMSETSHVK